MRTRNHAILFRLDDPELKHLQTQVMRSGLSMAAYLRALLSGHEVRPAPTEETLNCIGHSVACAST